MTGYSLKEISEQLNTGEIPNIANYGNTYTKDEVYTKTEVLGSFGNLSSPLLDLPLKNSLAMKAGVGSVTFTRATTATYIDRYGVLQYSAIDEPRFEKEGLLIEGGSTNFFNYSNHNSHSNWTKGGGFINTTIDSGVNNPDGTSGAVKVTSSDSVFANYRDIHMSQVILASYNIGDVITIRSHIKKGSNGRFRFRFFDDGGYVCGVIVEVESFTILARDAEITTCTIEEDILNDGWCVITATFTASLGVGTNIRVITQFSNSVLANSDYMYLDNMQVEVLPFATSYIPTTNSAVTRASEVCQITNENNEPNFLDEATYSMRVNVKGVHADYADLFQTEATRIVLNTNDGTEKLYVNKNNTYSNSYATVPYNSFEKVDVTYKDLNLSLYIDNVLFHTVSTANTKLIGRVGIVLGGGTLTGAEASFHIKSLKIYDKALTPTEVALA